MSTWTREEIDAELAVQAAATPGPWEPYFTAHGEGMVAPASMPYPSSRIADVSTSPADYGKANTEAIARARTNYPRALLALAEARDRIVELESALKDVIGVVRRSPVQFATERDRVLTELAEWSLAGERGE